MNKKTRLHKVIWDIVKENDFDYTNPEIQRNIENFGVFVDGAVVKNRLEWVYPSQKIEFTHWPQRDHGNFDKINVLYEDDSLLVLYKPPGIVVQPGAGHQTKNLVAWLDEKYNLNSKFDPIKYPSSGLINRIDKETQGIILVGKNESSKLFYQDQFRDRKVIKKYLAIVNGVVENSYNIEHWQSRSKVDPTRQKLFWSRLEAFNYDENSRNAIGIIQPIVFSKELNQTLIEVEIKTGRMHQIRLLCESLGFNLVGDNKYNKPKDMPKNIPSEKSATVKNLLSSQFIEKKSQIFGESEFSLLSNHISIKKINGEMLTVSYKEI